MDSKQIRDDLRKTYQKYAQSREERPLADWKIQLRAEFLASLQQEHKKKLLEIGAGTGKDSLFFQQNDLTVTCVDLSPEMINLCKQKGLDAHVMDMADLKFPTQEFDAVYSFNSLLHIPKPELPVVLKNIQRVLKSKGLFFLGTYGSETEFQGVREKDPYTPKRFFAMYPDEVIKQITLSYFELVKFDRIDFPDEKEHYQSLLLRNK